MKPLTLPSSLLAGAAFLVAFAGTTQAQGLNLSWTDCGSSGEMQRNFACDTNSGVNRLIASMTIGPAMAMLNGHEGVFDLQTNESTLSDWWKLGSTNCRAATAISVDFNFTNDLNCADPWQNAGLGAVNYVGFYGQPNRARIRTVYGINPPTTTDGTSEYYVARININNSRSTGLGSCAGCTDGACIVFNSAYMSSAIYSDSRRVTNVLNRRHVMWRAGQAGGGAIGGLGCPNALPARNRTWGSLKSLYR